MVESRPIRSSISAYSSIIPRVEIYDALSLVKVNMTKPKGSLKTGERRFISVLFISAIIMAGRGGEESGIILAEAE